MYKYGLPLIAILLALFALGHALFIQRPQVELPPPMPPPLTPFGFTVAGAGIVEPSTEASGTGNIAVGSQVAGAVTSVAVHIGQKVKAGDLLVQLDPRQAQADLLVRQANIPVAEAQVEVAEANHKQLKDQYDRAQMLVGSGSISQQDFVTIQQNFQAARAQMILAKASLIQVKAQVDQSKTNLDLLRICAPVNGTILQINIRPGEYLSTMGGQSLILLGSLEPYHVRVNVDEEDIPRLSLNLPARAKLRGDALQEEVPLKFVRLEPYVVPKASLTGANTERVDTRVVQLIYAIDPANHLIQDKKILVGQLVDVFIDTRPTSPIIQYPAQGKP